MAVMQPIRDIETMEKLLHLLRDYNYQYYVFFRLGTYFALRASDLIRLKVKQVRGTHVELKEKKTRKYKRIPIHPDVRELLDDWCKYKDDEEYLFPSKFDPSKHMSREQAYRVFVAIAKRMGITGIGTHTLRKTWSYHYYLRTKDIGTLMIVLNHSNERTTLAYIGVTQDRIDEAYMGTRYE